MPRRVYDSIAPYQECPRCRYPMLRAEKLGSVGDQITDFNPSESWIPALVYRVPLWFLLGWLSLKLSTGVIAGYAYLAQLPQLGSLWLAALVLLALEGLLAWHIVRWRGWGEWSRQLWRGRSTNSAYAQAQAQKPALARDFRYSDSGLEFMPMLMLGFLLPLTGQLLPLIEKVATQHQGTLAKLLVITVLLLGLVLSAGVPVFYDDIRAQFTRRRRRKRETLMATLAPSDWVCPSCLSVVPAPPDVSSRTHGLSDQLDG